MRLLVVDLDGAETTGWTSAAGTRSPYEQLRALGLALQRYKADTVVVRNLPREAAVGGAGSAAELLAASAELYYRAERDEAAPLCAGRDWDDRWWPRRCGRETMVASLRTVALAGEVAELGSGAARIALSLAPRDGAPLALGEDGALLPDGATWRVLRQAEDRFDGLLLRPARFYEVQRVAAAGRWQ